MRFLKMRRSSAAVRKCGTQSVTPLIVDSPRKFAPDSERTETTMSVKRCQLITGPHDSGKTRWLHRLHDEWAGIWGAKIKREPVFISGLSPLSVWTDAPHVATWHDEHEPEKPWKNLNQHHKADALAAYLRDGRGLLFVDDAHKLTGRKLQAARACVMAAHVWVISTSAENRIAPNLRPVIERRDPQRTRLQSDASYDATSLAMWMLIVVMAGAGWWEASLVLGGMKALGSGRNASKAD